MATEQRVVRHIRDRDPDLFGLYDVEDARIPDQSLEIDIHSRALVTQSNGKGTEMERKWNGKGTEMERKGNGSPLRNHQDSRFDHLSGTNAAIHPPFRSFRYRSFVLWDSEPLDVPYGRGRCQNMAISRLSRRLQKHEVCKLREFAKGVCIGYS